ncbi:MAG: hypothetical protein JSW68_06085, partial [Burkholderiales bacterium]
MTGAGESCRFATGHTVTIAGIEILPRTRKPRPNLETKLEPATHTGATGATGAILTLPALPTTGKRLALPPCAGSSDALAIAQLVQAARGRRRTVVVITAAAADAQRLADELPFFAPGERVCLFPDWETLPYDAFSPHEDLVSERLAALYALQRGELDAMV